MPVIRRNADANTMIAKRVPFRNSGRTLRGEEGPARRVGYLPDRKGWHESVRQARYVVYSYETPIAWEAADGRTVIPTKRYSPTTTQHQHEAAKGFGESYSVIYSTDPEDKAYPRGYFGVQGWGWG